MQLYDAFLFPTMSKGAASKRLLCSLFSTNLSNRLSLRCVAIRQEGVSDYLGGLASGGVLVGAEVGKVAGGNAWLACSPAWVPTHNFARGKAVNKVMEGAANRHILEEPGSLRVVEARSVRYYLGDLAPGGVTAGAEVGKVAGGHAWLGPRGYPASTSIAVHKTARSQPADELEEGAASVVRPGRAG